MRLVNLTAGATIVLAAACVFAQQTGQTIRHHRVPVEQQPAEVTEAENAIQGNNFPAAEELLKKALAKDPKNYQAWFDLGFVQNKLGRTDDSIHAYRQAVAAKPDVFESNLNLGLMLARSNSPEAEQFLRAATHLKPTAHVEEGQARAWLSLGHILERQKPDEAVAAYRQAAALTPKDPEPHLSAGLLLERQKDLAGAETEYKQVLALDPKSTEATIGLSNLYMKSGKTAEAEPLLRQLATERPEDADLHLQLGRVLEQQGKKDDAVLEYQQALKLVPSDIEAKQGLADLLYQSGKLEDAEKSYRELVAANPNDARLHQMLGECLLKQLKAAEAQEEFLKAVKIKPDFGEAYGSLAVAADKNKNYPLAIQALEARAKFLPEIPVSYFLRATAYDHLRDFKTASQYYHLFLDVAKGKYPDQEWQAQHRLIAIEPKKR